MKLYVLLEVGCLECGEDSKILGIWQSRAQAKSAFDKAVEEHSPQDTGERVAHNTSPGVVALFPEDGSGRGRLQLLSSSTFDARWLADQALLD